MLKFSNRLFALQATVLVAISVSALQSLASASQTDSARRGDIFQVRVTADKAVYAVGEPIMLRVTIMNRSADSYNVEEQPPAGLTGITVKLGNATVAETKGGPTGRRFMVGYKVPANGSVDARFSPSNGSAATSWQEIGGWGVRLTKPGTYSITLTANFWAWPTGNPSDGFYVRGPNTSNTIQIRIQK